MIRTIIIILLLAILGALLAQWLISDPGYIYLGIRGLSIETTLWLGIALLLVAFLMFLFAVRIIRASILFPAQIKYALHRRRHIRQRNHIKRSLLYLVSGNYNKIYDAAKSVFAPSNNLEMRIINAEAFLHSRHYDELIKTCQRIQKDLTDKKLAKEDSSQIIKASNILMARAYTRQNKYNRALKILEPYVKDAETEESMFVLLREIYQQDKHWQKLGELMSGRKHSMDDESNIQAILSYYQNHSNLDQIKKHWRTLDKKSGKDPRLISTYALALARNGDKTSSIELLQSAIKSDYNSHLIDTYKDIISNTPLQQLKFLEDIKLGGKVDESMLIALAKLSQMNKMEAKALTYYEEALNTYPKLALEHKLDYVRLLANSTRAGSQKKGYDLLSSIAGQINS